MPSIRSLLAALTLSACGRTELVGALPDGSESPPVTGVCAALLTAAADPELLDRWNRSVASQQPLTRDFRWLVPNGFPHPSFRLGDTVAYAEFSAVLVSFWRTSDNLDFVRCNALFDAPYRSGPPVATQKVVRLRPLTAELMTGALVPADRRSELMSICSLIGC